MPIIKRLLQKIKPYNSGKALYLKREFTSIKIIILGKQKTHPFFSSPVP